MPLFAVAVLLFILVMMVTGDKNKTSRFGFSTSMTIVSSSSLFIVVMLSHIQLRSEFSSVGVEYFYLLIYLMIILVAINNFIFSINRSSIYGIFSYEDNLIPKVIFWPLIFGLMIAITLINL